MTELQYPIPPLTDWQREKVREFYAANPKGGYKSALKHAGIRATRPVAQAIIQGDDELADVPYETLGISRQTALAAIGEILNDPEHKDRLRAALATLAMLYGMSEKQSLELSGGLEVDTDVADALDRFTAAVTAAAVRAADRDAADGDAGELDRQAGSGPRLAVARVAGPAESDAA